MKKRFVLEGFEAAIEIAPTNRLYRRRFDCVAEANLIMIACSKPPKEYAKWSSELLVDQIVELKYVKVISSETVRMVLKKNEL